MSIISSIRPRRGRNVELALLIFAVAIVLFAHISTGLGAKGVVPPRALAIGGIFIALTVAFHLVLRWRAPWADPLILPIVTVLNGMGLVMIDRIDLAENRTIHTGWAFKQLLWTGLGITLATLVVLFLRDHRLLRRYTYLAGVVGFVLLLMPLMPFIGTSVYSAKLWITIGSFQFQPGEISKILLTIFFAGYLVQTRDALSVAGKRVLGMQLPRGRDLAPILLAWLLTALLRPLRLDALRGHRTHQLGRHRDGTLRGGRVCGIPALRPRPGARRALAAHLLPGRPAGF